LDSQVKSALAKTSKSVCHSLSVVGRESVFAVIAVFFEIVILSRRLEPARAVHIEESYFWTLLRNGYQLREYD
jgi:hypothetical protein